MDTSRRVPSPRPRIAPDSSIEDTTDARSALPLQTLQSSHTAASPDTEMQESADFYSNNTWDFSGTFTDLMFRTLRLRVSPPPNQKHRVQFSRRRRNGEEGGNKQSRALGNGPEVRKGGNISSWGPENTRALRDGSGSRASARDQLSPEKVSHALKSNIVNLVYMLVVSLAQLDIDPALQCFSAMACSYVWLSSKDNSVSSNLVAVRPQLQALADQFDLLERRRLDYEERKARPQAKEALRILVHVRFLMWLGGASSR